jgi:uncharacterized protein (TIGR03086 family)
VDGAAVARHLRACDGFGEVVVAVAADAWGAASPCPGWSSADVVEHVIGFHEVLLLRPLGVRARRPRSDSVARWAATARAIRVALDTAANARVGTEIGEVDLDEVLPAITTDVLVHTWDLAVAADVDVELDADLVAHAWDHRPAHLPSSMYAPRVPVADDAPVAARLLAHFGRTPRSRDAGAR